jgi:tRNA(Arg) A34 adenosine deaminase TadA
LAYRSLVTGGLAVGSVLTDAGGRIVAEGRNRAYDPPGGSEVLRGTPLAHAEMNVFARVPTDRELGSDTLWSTQEPCSMCTAAAAFLGVGQVRYLAPDPWALAAEPPRSSSGVPLVGPADNVWLVCANVFFLYSIASRAGLDHSTVVRNRQLEPETAGIVVDLVAEGGLAAGLAEGGSVRVFLSLYGDRIAAAADARGQRLS